MEQPYWVDIATLTVIVIGSEMMCLSYFAREQLSDHAVAVRELGVALLFAGILAGLILYPPDPSLYR